MSPTAWIAFVLAYTLMALAPGPVVLLVVSHAVTHGRRTAGTVVAATALGDAACLVAAMGGVGAVLAASALAFTVLKLAGAAYLVGLGVKLWRAPPLQAAATAAAPPRALGRVFLHVFLTAVLNPKSILFFMVFVPQFLDPTAPLAPQLAAMVAGTMVCSLLVDGGYTLFAGRLRRFIRTPRAQRVVNRLAGGSLMAEGALAAVSRALVR